MTKTTKKTKQPEPEPKTRINISIEFELPKDNDYTGITLEDFEEWVLSNINGAASNFRIDISKTDSTPASNFRF